MHARIKIILKPISCARMIDEIPPNTLKPLLIPHAQGIASSHRLPRPL